MFRPQHTQRFPEELAKRADSRALSPGTLIQGIWVGPRGLDC